MNWMMKPLERYDVHRPIQGYFAILMASAQMGKEL
jgi:hypothetical protein